MRAGASSTATHARWQQHRSQAKFERLAAIGRALPKLRRAIAADLRRPGLPRERVLALVVSLIDRSGARVGNTEYRRSNGSFGLSTLRDRHLRVRGSRLTLEFRGKSGRHAEARGRRPRAWRSSRGAARSFPVRRCFST
jgi:DNA topoisomerase IB